nr:hypothetical protein [Tanacetum cinerariifolium]
MAPLTFADTHNMVAFLSKFDASAGFDQIFWATASIKKINNVVKLQALIDRKKVVVTKDIIQKDLRLDNTDGVECLPNEEILAELARMGYEKPPPKLTFYKACFMASAVICLATGGKFNLSKYIFDSMAAAEEDDEVDEVSAAPTPPSPTHESLPPPHEPITTPPQAQPASPSSPPQEQPTDTYMTLLHTLMETCVTLSQKVTHLEQDKITQALKIINLKQREDASKQKVRIKAMDADEDITLVTMTMAQTLIKMKAKKARLLDEQMAKRLHDEKVEQAAAREKQEKDDFEKAKVLQKQYVNKQENINWNVMVEQMQEKHLDNIRKYQSLKRKLISVAQTRKNIIIYLKNMAGYKMAHFRGMTYDQVRPIFEREYNKVQTFLKPDRDEEPTKKRVAEETLLQESFKKLRAKVEVSSSESTQETLTIDPKEMSEEDVQNMLQIIHSEGSTSYWKIIRVGGITEAYQSFEDMLKGFDREDLDALWRLVKEKSSTTMPTEYKEKALWVELKRLYEPNVADVFWKLQRYMHDPLTWKLYTNYGVHQVSLTRRHDIFMFPEKDYPSTDVDKDLVIKIFMEANKPKSRRSLDTSSK